MCVYVCVREKQKKSRKAIKFWPGFIFTRSWTHPGSLCCQVCFPPTQTRPLPCISPAILHCCLLQCLIQLLFLPFSFSFDIWFPGSMWYSKTHHVIPFKRQTSEDLLLDSAVCCINWPLGVSSWLKMILLCVWRASQPHSKVDLCESHCPGIPLTSSLYFCSLFYHCLAPPVRLFHPMESLHPSCSYQHVHVALCMLLLAVNLGEL